jgi:hypothetical protein
MTTASTTPIKTYYAPGDASTSSANPNISYAANALVLNPGAASGANTASCSNLKSTFVDGTSNTVLFMERYAVTQVPTANTTHVWYGTYAQVLLYITSTTGFQIKPALSIANDGNPQGMSVGGMQVGMADGSVRTVTSSTSANTFYVACTPAGGEVMPSDW